MTRVQPALARPGCGWRRSFIGLPPTGLLELDEDVVPAEGQRRPAASQLGVEDVRQRQRALEEDAPGRERLGRGA